jgi:signal transduction histidine kinase
MRSLFRSFFDLSFRIKIPIWGSLLIVVSAGLVSVSLMFRAYDDLRHDVLISADSLGRTLAKTLFPIMLHDQLWRAYETLNAPFHGATPENPVQASALVLLDNRGRVYVASDPQEFPTLADFATLGPDTAAVFAAVQDLPGDATRSIDPAGSGRLWVAAPIRNENLRQGTLLLVYSKTVFLPRFVATAGHAGGVALLVLAILLPINWYWGRRMAVPLVQLSSTLRAAGRRLPENVDPGIYAYRDELGELFTAVNRMIVELRANEQLKNEMVKDQRLAALGRLASGVAHEVNNPLAGMLTAIDTLKQRPDLDARTAKTVGLIERGLWQIRDTVRALLVETKATGRSLTPTDIDDIRTLLHAQAEKKSLHLDWHNDLAQPVTLPANLVRQVLINLLLNAIQAAAPSGYIGCAIAQHNGTLRLEVRNDGARLSDQQLEDLFEPFMHARESGHGLGLWVTYQIVQQLGGSVAAANEPESVRFTVNLPIEPTA